MYLIHTPIQIDIDTYFCYKYKIRNFSFLYIHKLYKRRKKGIICISFFLCFFWGKDKKSGKGREHRNNTQKKKKKKKEKEKHTYKDKDEVKKKD